MFFESSLGGSAWLNLSGGVHHLDSVFFDEEEEDEVRLHRDLPVYDLTFGFSLWERLQVQLRYAKDYVYEEWGDAAAVQRMLHAEGAYLNLESNFGPHERARAELKNAWLSDRNRQRSADLVVLSDRLLPGVIWLGVGGYYNSFRQQLDDYWSPRKAYSLSLRSEYYVHIGGNFFAEGLLNVGPSREEGQKQALDYFAQARGVYRHESHFELGLFAGHMESLKSDGNWRRTDFGLTLGAPL